GYKVTMLRPGGGTGGKVADEGSPNTDVYDLSSRRLGFHWDPHFIHWLETNGYQVDYCTDLDIHEDKDLNLLSAYRLLLSVGHDEYWSEEMRKHVETFIVRGGNVAFFSGNTCWWRVEYDDGNTAIVCKKPDEASWWKIGRPENTLTGVSYRCAGGRWTGERAAVGYTVQHADHWVYEGTGLHNGDVFGKNAHLIGYECDGAFFGSNRDSQGFFAPTGDDQTPKDFKILGYSLLEKNAQPPWEDLPQPPKDETTSGSREKVLVGSNAATMGIYIRNGTVFTAATTDWVRVLAISGEKAVEQITHNVLRRLSTRKS
ncbi:MAG TPA: N,N-dimethylformamidase beta subunit family domain-containing protein, partial [Ktedonobacteraceae bacterium]|nr:N,N-dimethylformamidase beta subunit family domain-containing protein [Ktedonobacteraceae bacterium]